MGIFRPVNDVILPSARAPVVDARGVPWEPQMGGVIVSPRTIFGSLSSLEAWFRDDSWAAAQWSDLSGNGNHATQATGSKQPAGSGSINGRTCPQFDGTDDWYSLGNVLNPANGDFFAFAVIKTTATAVQRVFQKRGTGAAGSNAGWALMMNTTTAGSASTTIVDDGATHSRQASTTGRSLNSNTRLFGMVFDRAGGSMAIYVDGAVVETITAGGTFSGSVTTTREMTIGGAWDASGTQSQFYAGAMGELVFGRVKPSQAQLDAYFAYSRARWGHA